MGFSNFLTLFHNYIKSDEYKNDTTENSDICYIDFTNKIISVCYTINKYGVYKMKDSLFASKLFMYISEILRRLAKC